MAAPWRVVVVGSGPRGVAVLERVLSNAGTLPSWRRVEVHVVDAHQLGGGRVWRSDQPDLLLMNVAAAQTTVFTDGTVTCRGPVRPGPTLYEWVTRHEPDGLRPWSYAGRAQHGRYLRWAFDDVVSGRPGNVTVELHADRAVELTDHTGDTQRLRLRDGKKPLTCDVVVLAQGHLDTEPTGQQRVLADFADRHGLTYVRPTHPADVEWDRFPAGDPVLVRGLGANFYDAMAMLTLGRGGSFARSASGRLVYLRSGAEPVLYAGSRRGLPFAAQPDFGSAGAPRYERSFLDDGTVRSMRQRVGALDFRTDVWPSVRAELAHATAELLGQVTTPEPWTDPYPEDPFGSAAAFQDWVEDRLERDLEEARHPSGSAAKLMGAVLRDLYGPLRSLVSHRGLTGGSHRDDLDGWFTRWVVPFIGGPPAVRVEQLGALADAGLVRFVGPGMRVTADEGVKAFTASAARVRSAPVSATALLDACMPVPDVAHTSDPLLAGLYRRGDARPYTVPDPAGADHVTGGVDIRPGVPYLVGGDGRAHERRLVFGVPTEPAEWTTTTTARPGVDSHLLRGADAVARAVLGMDEREVGGSG